MDDNFDNNLDASILPKNLAVINILTQILSDDTKNCLKFMQALNMVALKRTKERIFEIKSVPVEYFQALLFRNKHSTNVTGDIKSYALLSINSLAALAAKNESWVKLRMCNISDPTQNGASSVKISQPSEIENPYLIQCYAVSSIENGFIIYVTNEKYYNILQHFEKSITTGPVHKVQVMTSDLEIQPPVAKSIVLGCIEPGIEIGLGDVKEMISTMAVFRKPKHLKLNEVFKVNLKEILPVYHWTYFNVECIYFKILNFTLNTMAEKEDIKRKNVGFFISEEETKITLITHVHSFTPPLYTKYISLKNRLGYEISMCPEGLRQYNTKLESFFRTFLNGNEFSFKPMILLTGPKGSGKKTVLNCVTKRFGLKIYSIDCFDFIGMDASALDTKLSALTHKVKQSLHPAVFFLDNVELLGRDELFCENVSMTDIFKTQIEKVFQDNEKSLVIVVGSSCPKSLEILPSIHRMFIQNISFKAMNKEEAFALLKWLVNEAGMSCFPEVLEKVVDRVSGYLFADLTKLIRIALKFQREDMSVQEVSKIVITENHWERAIKIMEELYSDTIGTAKVPSVHWEDVGGLEHLKEEITLALELPKKYPELAATGLGASGFLFYGPPGTGKTLMAKTVATEFNYNFLSVKGPELMNMYVGQSEKNVREVFQRARDAAPCIIFFDELDSLAPNRGCSSGVVTDRIVSQLLTEMDGMESNKGIFIIGATNRPDLVDPALLRPGRFDKMFYVGVCESPESKLSVIKALTRRFTLGQDVDLASIAELLPPQVTGADIYSICSNAWLEAARKCIKKINEDNLGENPDATVIVNVDDFQRSLSNFVPSLTPDIIADYENLKDLQK